MAGPFAKLFDTPHGQLLVVKDGVDDDDQYPLSIRGEEFGGVIAAFNPAYQTSDACDAAFERFDQAEADRQAEGLRKMLTSLLSEEPAT